LLFRHMADGLPPTVAIMIEKMAAGTVTAGEPFLHSRCVRQVPGIIIPIVRQPEPQVRHRYIGDSEATAPISTGTETA